MSGKVNHEEVLELMLFKERQIEEAVKKCAAITKEFGERLASINDIRRNMHNAVVRFRNEVFKMTDAEEIKARAESLVREIVDYSDKRW